MRRSLFSGLPWALAGVPSRLHRSHEEGKRSHAKEEEERERVCGSRAADGVPTYAETANIRQRRVMITCHALCCHDSKRESEEVS